jgi:tRNA G10  N-methylase Trm11
MIEAKYKGVSPLETFNSYSLFYKVLEYSLNTDKSILPNFIYNNLIHFNGGVVGFPCSVAKVIVEKFSPEDGVVVDPCAGWGGRLIGASVLNRSYIGFEPWDKTARGLNNIINFFEIKKAVIFNTEFNIEKAPEQCSLVFTSPPYIDLEVYGKPMKIEDWKNLMSSIIKYAEESLVLGGYLVLNIPRFLKNLLPETFLKEEESIYWFTSSRKKNLDKAEILYIWSRQ